LPAAHRPGELIQAQAFAMNRFSFSKGFLCCCVLAVGFCGCADSGPKRYAVSGMVTWQGKPLDHGSITFLAEDPSLGSGGGDMIQDGRYSIPAKQGLLPGRYKVSISSADPRDKAPDPDSPPGYLPVSKDRIAPKYNTKTTLTADVTPQGQNTFDFDVD
jgi:hypothetical protein